jgi:hypothetical protein
MSPLVYLLCAELEYGQSHPQQFQVPSYIDDCSILFRGWIMLGVQQA